MTPSELMHRFAELDSTRTTSPDPQVRPHPMMPHAMLQPAADAVAAGNGGAAGAQPSAAVAAGPSGVVTGLQGTAAAAGCVSTSLAAGAACVPLIKQPRFWIGVILALLLIGFVGYNLWKKWRDQKARQQLLLQQELRAVQMAQQQQEQQQQQQQQLLMQEERQRELALQNSQQRKPKATQSAQPQQAKNKVTSATKPALNAVRQGEETLQHLRPAIKPAIIQPKLNTVNGHTRGGDDDDVADEAYVADGADKEGGNVGDEGDDDDGEDDDNAMLLADLEKEEQEE